MIPTLRIWMRMTIPANCLSLCVRSGAFQGVLPNRLLHSPSAGVRPSLSPGRTFTRQLQSSFKVRQSCRHPFEVAKLSRAVPARPSQSSWTTRRFYSEYRKTRKLLEFAEATLKFSEKYNPRMTLIIVTVTGGVIFIVFQYDLRNSSP